jgi:shikimate kinase
MRIALFGISCVGKTTVGAILASKLEYDFIDFDGEVSRRMGLSISRLKDTCFNEYAYRQKVKHILPQILEEHPDKLVIAMPPSGLFREYKTVFEKNPDVLTIALRDKAINILKRLVFTDDDDNIVDEEVVTYENAGLYYEDIKQDIAYYYATLRKARLRFDMDGMDAETTATRLVGIVESA